MRYLADCLICRDGSASLSVSLSLAAALGASFALDAFALPRARRRSGVALILHVFALMFLTGAMLIVTRRLLFSACMAIALVGLLATVSNAKYESLREPFVFTDLSLFSQLFAHPRLYLPFLSVGKVIGIVIGVTALLSGFFAERPFDGALWPVMALLVAFAVMTCWLATRLPLTLDAGADQQRHGFFAVFVAYLVNGLRPATLRAFEEAARTGPFESGAPTAGPDVIVIQSESYFDARRLGSAIDSANYRNLDIARGESICHGELLVPAWGANTMRTEFAMLSGLTSVRLGYARFYPYAFVRRACTTIAAWFRRGGYTTVAIHPYYADFFGRNRVFPLLGFDKFLDIESFVAAPRAGPYIADSAVLDTVIDVLDEPRSEPRFLFAMTMENHGPLHLEQVLPGESSSRHTLGEDASWRDLTAYLRHIENADAMIGRLLDHLRTSARETVVCFYGDHVPALPHVFQKLGVTPQRSDYFIWRNYGTDTPECRNLAAEELGSVLLHVVQDDGHRAEQPHASEKAT
ncbi:LTA synthase family protein [Burkholderia cenocepacia]|uniref:LTA synthase family protein n=1 Tax=Burkholderia cenocepacia TaxID=95486 RepID=UPI00068EBFA6|nr:LTA synthase family protein [Burkholderia cenocepacia]MBR7992506.1 LTA synthase family protein [Burkholderia cenocepacia]MBR8409348.1 LTA synthase family protein [Burkholderia cenocepacia]